jgi:hypothetical protein
MYFLCTDYRYKKYIYFQAYLNIIQMKNKYNEACMLGGIHVLNTVDFTQYCETCVN